MTLVAGVDCSTQSTKALVVDTDSGEIVATGKAPHTVEGTDGAAETSPEVWWEALAAALGETGRAGDIAGISIGAQQHGLVVVDAEGAPLRPAILWCDTRSAPDAEHVIAGLGGPKAAAQLLGSVPLAAFTVTNWAWVRRLEPDIVRAARGMRLPHDWLTEKLTGEAVTDRGDASTTGWWSALTEGYASEALDLEEVLLDPALLPRVLGSSEIAGHVTAEAAEHLGLRPGIPVGPGTGDNPAAALGLGLEVGTPVISLGTSGTVYVRSTRASADPSGMVLGLADAVGTYLPLVCTTNCTLAVDRMAALLGTARDAVAAETSAVVLPYFDGERTPYVPQAATTITGVRSTTTPGEVLLATYQGAAASLLEGLDELEVHSSGLDADASIVLIGGGARGDAWRRVVGQMSGRGLEIPDQTELVAMGAAVQAAAVATGAALEETPRAWGTRAGAQVAPPEERDQETVSRIRSTREKLREVNEQR